MGAAGEVSSRSASAVTSQNARTALTSAAMTANGLWGRSLRSRSRARASRLKASAASRKPPIPRTVYAKPYAIARKLVETVGEENVAKAFYDGNISSMSGEFGPTRWTNFLEHINGGKYDRAEAVLEKVRSSSEGAAEEEEGDLSEAFTTLFGGEVQ